MHPILIFQLVVLVGVANGTPVLAKRLLGNRFAWPLDGGAVFVDGRPLLGLAKTARGIVTSLLATPLAAALMGLSWELGVLIAATAMAGDLLSSFVKRRLGYEPSSKAVGLDQIPESLVPLAACRLLIPVSLLDIAAGTAIFFVGELALSRVLYKLQIRDKPY